MKELQWNINEMLSVSENIIYQCILEDEEYNSKIEVYLTNFRIIWIEDEFVDCRTIKHISKYGVYVGSNDYREDDDIGTGEYGIYFGDNSGYTSFWFYSQDVCKEFYDELSRAVIETL